MSEPTSTRTITAADYVVLLAARAISLMMTLALTRNESYLLPDGKTLAESAESLSAEATDAYVSYEANLAIGCPHCKPGEEHEDCVAAQHAAVELLYKVALSTSNIASVCSGEFNDQQIAMLPASLGLESEEVARVFLHDEEMRQFLETQGVTKTSSAYRFLYTHCRAWDEQAQ